MICFGFFLGISYDLLFTYVSDMPTLINYFVIPKGNKDYLSEDTDSQDIYFHHSTLEFLNSLLFCSVSVILFPRDSWQIGWMSSTEFL